jgi:hypothetical protein
MRTDLYCDFVPRYKLGEKAQSFHGGSSNGRLGNTSNSKPKSHITVQIQSGFYRLILAVCNAFGAVPA